MNNLRVRSMRRALLIGLAALMGLGLAAGLLVFGHVSQVLADPDIIVDGSDSDWDSDWVVHVDGYDAIHSGDTSTATRFSSSFYARTGFEALTVSAHFENGYWYFKLDIDGRPADQDSATGGTASNPAVGTTGDDGGPLADGDQGGLGEAESYQIRFDRDGDGSYDVRLEFKGTEPEQPVAGTIYSTTSGYKRIVGEAAYSDSYTPTGVVEFSVPKLTLFPAGQCFGNLGVLAHAGSLDDNVTDDTVPNTGFKQLLDFDLTIGTLTATISSDPMTYTIAYTITGHSAMPAHNAYITQSLDANSHYVSCSPAVCNHSGGTITWTLTTPITPGTASATGSVTSVVTNTGSANRTTYVAMRSDEGLCGDDSITHGPTRIVLRELRADPSARDSSWWLAAVAVVGLVTTGAMTLFTLARRRKA